MKLAIAGGAALVFVVLLIAAPIAALTSATGSAQTCTMSTTPDVANFNPDQVANAATIVATGNELNVPEAGQVVAVATAMQESGLRNLDYGDRDSLGLFQQRPSQGWGTPEQVTDPEYAATQFYNHLLALPNWQNLTVNDAAQAVQRSGTPRAYAKHEQAARALVAAVRDTICTVAPASAGPPRTDWPTEQATEPDPTSNGRVTPRTTALVQVLRKNGMTGTGLGCHAARPANPDSDHPQGRACDVMFNPHDQNSVAEGWQVANWLIANQPNLGVRYLIWQGKYWSADEPTWVPYRSSAYGCPNPANLTGCHYDHVHISMY